MNEREIFRVTEEDKKLILQTARQKSFNAFTLPQEADMKFCENCNKRYDCKEKNVCEEFEMKEFKSFRFGREEDEYRNRYGLMDLSWQNEEDIDKYKSLRNEFINRCRNFMHYCRNSYPEYYKFSMNELLSKISPMIREKELTERFGEKYSNNLQEELNNMNMVLISKRIRTDAGFWENDREQEEKKSVYGDR